MKYLEGKIKNKPQNLHVVLMNDIHIGSEALDYDFLKRVFKFIDENRENTRILINGDIFEMVTKQSKGDLFEQTLSPEQQIDKAVELFKPYADLIDCVTSGNHDQRLQNETSIDPVRMFCRYLGIEDRYAGYEAIVGFSFRKKLYTVYQFHGANGGSTVAAIERNMKKYKEKSNAHIVYTGHWHKQFSKPLKFFSFDPYNKVIREEKHWLVCGNTCVQTAKYAKKFGYEESFPSQAVLTLSGSGRKNVDVNWIY
ncbi:DNA repair exonuclease [Bacillus phage Staley]|uniref:Metal-dependent hydrolase n=1 Tax=Bacillus phage Staley TaxID=1406792 RepID=U5Q178_9CAUD|nr:DNA repair exonuclease [Bacillus phage Staley]AGY48712.1 metal-dependent hydrolase [Bacillus phage Staley]